MSEFLCKVCGHYDRDERYCRYFKEKLNPDNMARGCCSEHKDIRVIFVKDD